MTSTTSTTSTTNTTSTPTGQASLLRAAADGSLDSAEWPATLQYILDRLDEIIHEFPKPPADTSADADGDADTSTPAPADTSTPAPADAAPKPEAAAASAAAAAARDKENAPPTTPPRPPPVPVRPAPESKALPPATTSLYASIRNALSLHFAKQPPHTVQRLAELVLEPKRRYKHLSPYLRALDRVVSVSSPLAVFPLPQAVLPSASGLLNGTAAAPNPHAATLGSDESLGGALLTPIPWLHSRGQNELISESTEMVDGPNGAGRIETVTVGMLSGQPPRQEPAASSPVSQIASSHPDGETLPSTGPVTQGELLRQEQQAGIVLNNPHSLTTSPTRTSFGESEGGATVVETVEAEEEAPHARGPETIGLEDTGPQKQGASLDIEGAVGRPSLERSSRSPGRATAPGAESKDEKMEDAGETMEDAGETVEDAGEKMEDAGETMEDAGEKMEDAGETNEDDKAAEEQLQTGVAEQEKESEAKDVDMKYHTST
ncbi:uncharacterized protein M421DRAFT_7180 [Didymella exigua CBS 183.55]|uniref:PPP4R2-domain-containing protein n=1 Tax=Didymella exigua CBS 183.55 TaxID=1150837 RepID=A0A6A5RFL2_9PLEO|nr:uncharacterized protein M421DRAFT_7180 [Didymella exigua CBS 183.55]KAF1926249.1 hypothetical protein M421DRAFT_7180 [Didymella exigua CBS 183.55]